MTMLALKNSDNHTDELMQQLRGLKGCLIFVNGVPCRQDPQNDNIADCYKLLVDGACCSIELSPGKELNVVEVFTGLDGRSYNVATDVHVPAGASLWYTKIQAQSSDSEHTATTRIGLDENARLFSVVLTCGGKSSRDDFTVKLSGRNAQAHLYGLYAVRGEQLVDHHTTVDHVSAQTLSRQIYKGILDDRARAVFNGRVIVASKAQHADSSQLNKNLLLGKEAHVDTKPELEIAANDVACTHGATVGQISAAELFYLQTRAIDREQAQKILVHAFVDDILDHVKDAAIRELMAKTLELNFWGL